MNDFIHLNQLRHDLCVIMLDDDEFQLAFTTDLLNDIGVNQVLISTNGNDALTQIAQAVKKPDVVICDLDMPGMDGCDFMTALAQSRYQGGVLIVSGQNRREIDSAAVLAQLSALNYLGELKKPVSSAQLQTLISKLK